MSSVRHAAPAMEPIDLLAVTASPPFSLLAVIVLYRCDPGDSKSLQSLLRTQQALPASSALPLTILLVDNTPDRGARPPVPEGMLYLSCPQNLGLANAYNQAIRLASQHQKTWLLTLDQDTTLPEHFLSQVSQIASHVHGDPTLAAILPQISTGGTRLSPYVFRAGALPSWFPDGYVGIPSRPVYAFNSAALLRITALEQAGGYDPLFWLDNSDAALFHKLHLLGKRVFVAGSLHVAHEFSMKNLQQRVTPWRYRHLLLAESAFWDQQMNWLAGVERTLRLALRLLKQLVRRDPAELCRITLHFFGLRLFRSRAYRLAVFRAAVQEHLGSDLLQTALPARPLKVSVCMASYNGAAYVAAQLESILTQLSPQDEVVIVDDASSDDTLERIQALRDARIRLIAHSNNQGVVRTFEHALRAATGDLLFLADDDDLWAPDKVTRFVAAFQQAGRVQIVMSAVALIDADDVPFKHARWDRNGRFHPGFLRNILKNQYQGAAMALRATLLGRILPFPSNRGYLHDVWIGTVNERTGGELAYLPEPLLLYRRHSSNYSRKLSRWSQLKLRLHLVEDHLKRMLPTM